MTSSSAIVAESISEQQPPSPSNFVSCQCVRCGFECQLGVDQSPELRSLSEQLIQNHLKYRRFVFSSQSGNRLDASLPILCDKCASVVSDIVTSRIAECNNQISLYTEAYKLASEEAKQLPIDDKDHSVVMLNTLEYIIKPRLESQLKAASFIHNPSQHPTRRSSHSSSILQLAFSISTTGMMMINGYRLWYPQDTVAEAEELNVALGYVCLLVDTLLRQDQQSPSSVQRYKILPRGHRSLIINKVTRETLEVFYQPVPPHKGQLTTALTVPSTSNAATTSSSFMSRLFNTLSFNSAST